MPKTDSIETRQCVRCGEERPLTAEHFYADRSRVDAFRYSCKPCHAEQNRERGWAGASRAQRHRKGISLTIADETRERLDLLAKRTGRSMSEVAEALIMAAAMPRARK